MLTVRSASVSWVRTRTHCSGLARESAPAQPGSSHFGSRQEGPSPAPEVVLAGVCNSLETPRGPGECSGHHLHSQGVHCAPTQGPRYPRTLELLLNAGQTEHVVLRGSTVFLSGLRERACSSVLETRISVLSLLHCHKGLFSVLLRFHGSVWTRTLEGQSLSPAPKGLIVQIHLLHECLCLLLKMNRVCPWHRSPGSWRALFVTGH